MSVKLILLLCWNLDRWFGSLVICWRSQHSTCLPLQTCSSRKPRSARLVNPVSICAVKTPTPEISSSYFFVKPSRFSAGLDLELDIVSIFFVPLLINNIHISTKKKTSDERFFCFPSININTDLNIKNVAL